MSEERVRLWIAFFLGVVFVLLGIIGLCIGLKRLASSAPRRATIPAVLVGERRVVKRVVSYGPFYEDTQKGRRRTIFLGEGDGRPS